MLAVSWAEGVGRGAYSLQAQMLRISGGLSCKGMGSGFGVREGVGKGEALH